MNDASHQRRDAHGMANLKGLIWKLAQILYVIYGCQLCDDIMNNWASAMV